MRIYVAGPISLGDPMNNFDAVLRAASELVRRGHAPFVPHLNGYFLSAQQYETWMKIDAAWLEVSDGLFRVPGPSAGAEREIELARSFGKPVWFDFDAIPDTL